MTDDFAPAPDIDLASIVIPAVRVDPWLEQAIDSALDSDYRSIEVIVVLNGAAEGATPRQHADPRVRVLRFPQRLGPAGGSVEGLRSARGRYYVRLDADDLMAPDRVRKQVEYLASHPDVAVVSSRVSWIDSEGSVVGSFAYPVGHDVRRGLARKNVVPHSSVAVRMADVERVGGYDPTMQQMEDYDLILRLSLGGAVCVLPETLSKYRLHPSQLSRAVLPAGRYVSVILARRRALARTMGYSRLSTLWSDTSWVAQQWAMFAYRLLRSK